MVCGRKHIVNLNRIKSVHICEKFNSPKDFSAQHYVVLTFNSNREQDIKTNTWNEAEKLYHEIDDKLCEIKGNQI